LNNISQFRINKLIIFTQYEKNILLFSQLCFKHVGMGTGYPVRDVKDLYEKR
jgi:hypothetical protein